MRKTHQSPAQSRRHSPPNCSGGLFLHPRAVVYFRSDCGYAITVVACLHIEPYRRVHRERSVPAPELSHRDALSHHQGRGRGHRLLQEGLQRHRGHADGRGRTARSCTPRSRSAIASSCSARRCQEWGSTSPSTLGGSPVGICLYFPDVDDRFAAGRRRMARPRSGPCKDQFYGDRSGTIIDPFGHVWTIATHIEDVPEAK